jgi:hypothetical protein
MPCSKAVRRRKFIGVDLEITALDVDGNELSIMRRFQSTADCSVVDCVSASGELVFAVSWLGDHCTPF